MPVAYRLDTGESTTTEIPLRPDSQPTSMTKRHVELPAEAASDLEAFIGDVDRRLRAADDTDALATAVTEIIAELHGERDRLDQLKAGESVSPVAKARLRSMDPRYATLESEYYAEVDRDAFAQSKILQYLWRRFDDSPIADNVAFALRFRRMLAEHLFEDVGEDVRLFRNISMTYGHNLSLGDNVVIHDDVHLDDRGELELGDRVSIADGVHIYSHDHDVVDQTEVRNYRTIIEGDARITQGAMLRAGVRVGTNALVGARAVVQGDVPAHHVVVGMPAKSIGPKPGFEDTAPDVEEKLADRRSERELGYSVPADMNVFDEFDRPEAFDEPVNPHEES